jgi:hypothetical protein
MQNRLTVQTHIGEGAIDSKKIVTTPRLLRLEPGGRVRRGGGRFCKPLVSVMKDCSVFLLCASHRVALQLGRIYTPIRFKQIVTSAPRPAAALCCSGHMSLRALGGVRSCMQLNRFWFIPRNRVAPAPCQCCHCCGMNAAAAAWMRPTASRA